MPHLTVGQGCAVDELRTAERSVRAYLPIEAEACAVTLMTEPPAGGLMTGQSAAGQWAKAATFPLA